MGAACMTAVKVSPAFASAYENHGAGGLMGEVLHPLHGFGQFLLVLLALSIIGCNLVNVYSAAFMCQNFHPWALRVPRFVYTILATAIIIAVSIAGEDSFNEVLESFLDVIGYYVTPFLACIAFDYFFFRHRSLPLDDWNDMNKLPVGIAGFFAVGMGFVGGVLFMDQKWYEGVVSRAIKPDGCELGWLFSGVFSLIGFVPARLIERHFTGR